MNVPLLAASRLAEVFHPLADDVLRDPYPFYRRLRGQHAVVYLEALDWYAVTRYADALHVLRSTAAFSSSIMRSADRVLLGQDPPAHTQVRRRVARPFTASTVANMHPLVERVMQPWVTRFLAQRGGDVVGELAAPVAGSIVAALLAIETERWSDFKRWSEAVVAAASGTIPSERRADFARDLHEFDDYMRELVARKQREPGDDLLSALLHAGGEPFDDAELRSYTRLLVIAASETTTHLLSNAVLVLATAPAVQDELRRDPSTSAACVEESLRFNSPVQVLLRSAVADIVLQEVRIPCRASVAVMIGSANRDERRFVDPDSFRLARGEPHLAFGAGPHVCLGSALARLVAEVALASLVRGSQRIELAQDVSDIEWARSLQLRGPKRLAVETA